VSLSFQILKADEAARSLVKEGLDQEGFFKIEGVLSPDLSKFFKEQARTLWEEELERIRRGDRDADIDFQTYNFEGAHLYNTPRQSRVFDPLLSHKDVISLLDYIFGAKCILNQTELRNPVKGARDNYAYEWHRDGRFVSKDTLWIIVFWLLDDVNEENGPTEVKPRTHFSKSNDHSEKVAALTGKAGDIVLMNNNLMHRASVNVSGADRWIFIPTYNPWFIKPSMDYTKAFTKKTFDQFSDVEKQIFGYTSIVPSDERKRLYTLRPWQQILDEIPFLVDE